MERNNKPHWLVLLASWVVREIGLTLVFAGLTTGLIMFVSYGMVNNNHESMTVSWWLVPLIAIGMLAHYVVISSVWRWRTEMAEDDTKVALRKQASEMNKAHQTELDDAQRRFSDLRDLASRLTQSHPHGPGAELARLVLAEQLPSDRQTVTRQEYEQILADRHQLQWFQRAIDTASRLETENAEQAAQLERFHQDWQRLGEFFRVQIKALYLSKGQTPPSLARDLRIAMVRKIHEFWGEESYAWMFVRDLGATEDVE